MNQQTAKAIFDAAMSTDLEVEIRDGYSGRGMFGRKTTAIIFDELADLLVPVAQAARDIPDEAEAEAFLLDVANLRFDNLGRSQIAY